MANVAQSLEKFEDPSYVEMPVFFIHNFSHITRKKIGLSLGKQEIGANNVKNRL